MGQFVTVGSASAIEDLQMQTYDVGGQAVTVARVDGKLWAFADTCTHARCSLADGDLEGTSIICPCHDGEFDLTDGQPVEGPPFEPIATFTVREQGDQIQIEI